MWQGVIFIGREFLEKVSKVETMQHTAEVGIEFSLFLPPPPECLVYKKYNA